MSLRLMSAAWAANLPSTPKLVLLALADNANDEGNCAPAIKTIMGKCSLSERAIFTNINLLEKSGFLLRQSRQFKSNIYTITPPNTWQTERAKPSKQRKKQAEADEKMGDMGAFGAGGAFNAGGAPNAPTTITIKSKPIGICAGDASTREVHANAWVRDAVVDTLPGWVDREAFFEFREHRRAIKKPLTPQSEKIALKTLFDVFNNGESQREIIERSILNGWAGLFANSKKNSSGNKPAFNAFNYLVEKNRGAGNERDVTNECE